MRQVTRKRLLLALLLAAMAAHSTGSIPEASAQASPDSSRDPALESAIERVKADLARHLGAPVDKIRTVSAEGVVWRDTSMGCGNPTESHAQVDVEGYQVILEHAGTRYDYRVKTQVGTDGARKDGDFLLCIRFN